MAVAPSADADEMTVTCECESLTIIGSFSIVGDPTEIPIDKARLQNDNATFRLLFCVLLFLL